jgi:hypothetical protein
MQIETFDKQRFTIRFEKTADRCYSVVLPHYWADKAEWFKQREDKYDNDRVTKLADGRSVYSGTSLSRVLALLAEYMGECEL